MRGLLATLAEPKAFIMTVNAGTIPDENWVHDPQAGGGRVIGEACHFVDLLRHLCGHPVVSVQSAMLGPNPALAIRDDKISFTLSFADGSIGTVHYGQRSSLVSQRAAGSVRRAACWFDNFSPADRLGWKNSENEPRSRIKGTRRRCP